jgi:hypothetical protein
MKDMAVWRTRRGEDASMHRYVSLQFEVYAMAEDVSYCLF